MKTVAEKHEVRLETPACPYCGALSRKKFVQGSGGKNSLTQHPRFRVCGRGHEFVSKRR